MLIDGREIRAGTCLETDICVIGAGAAGITICKELLSAGRDIVLLEAGGLKWDKLSQSLYAGESLSPNVHAPPHMYRQRRFGGSTTTWGGRCVPLDKIDFASRPWVPNSGWPFGRTDVDPYYRRAMPYFEAGNFSFEAPEALPNAKPIVDGFDSSVVETGNLERFSAPTDFGKVHGAELTRSERLRVIVHASCLELVRLQDGQTVSQIRCTSVLRNTFAIKATIFVVASGGLEVTRLLLVSAGGNGRGLGNGDDLVGRNYMCHIEGCLAALQLKPSNRSVAWGFDQACDGTYIKRRFQLTEQAQVNNRLLNTIFRLHHAITADFRHRNPVLSAMFLVKRFVIPEYRRKLAMKEHAYGAEQVSSARQLMRHVLNIACHAPDLARFSVDWVVRRHLRYRRIPYVALRSKDGVYPLDFNAEQRPNPNSRVLLSQSRDALGMRQLIIDWRLADEDVRSIIDSHSIFAKAVAESGVGEIEYLDRDVEAAARRSVPVGGHHIGTTRMDSDPRKGVVDEQCRLHEAGNVYIASSSVFPTCGNANPTLTIVALAIRIADHIKLTLSPRSKVAGC
jgi:choline dehydrogenase-like flavoprotein